MWKSATQTVFGEGPRFARLFLVGEQPGNDEDIEGHPFVGPAGRVLDRALRAAQMDRSDTYVTNVVKHFKWTRSGARRLHKKPNAREIGACIPWLEREIELIEPHVIVCLGATAAQALLGPAVRVSVDRGRPVETRFVRPAVPTVHPSSILRLPPIADRDAEFARFVADLEVARDLSRTRAGRPGGHRAAS